MTIQEAQAFARADGCSVEWWTETIGHRGQPAVLAVYYGSVLMFCLYGPLLAAMDADCYAGLIRAGRRAVEVCGGLDL